MTSADLKRSVIEELRKLPVYIVNSSGIQHTVRCPYCGDSKNPTHGHFSIKIDCDDPETPMLYKCFRCGMHGLITTQVLDELGVNTSNLNTDEMKSLNKKVAKKNKITSTVIEPYDIIDYTNKYDKRIRIKVDYINNRLGTEFDYRDLVKLNIVPSVIDFLKINKVTPTNRGSDYSDKYLAFLDYNYVGFLSYNRNLLVLRSINEDLEYRYVKMTLNKKNKDTNSFYSIKNSIDLLYNHDINIHIAEGTMDILGVYANINNFNLERNYYYASCGFDYGVVLRNLIRIGINTGINLHIYADNDKPDTYIINQLYKSGLNEWVNSIMIHRNSLDKDYGVPINQINDTIRKIF